MAKVICPAPGVQLTVIETANTSPLEVKFYFMPMYGPQEWFEYEPQTLVPCRD